MTTVLGRSEAGRIQRDASPATRSHDAAGDPSRHPAAPGSPFDAYLTELHARHRATTDGAVATYIPELGRADPAWFGISAVTLDGSVHAVGDAHRPFTIQSISKPLTYALALDALGEDTVRRRIGVEPTGDAFNAITLAPQRGTPLNPMVNAGAIAATAMIPPRDGLDATATLLAGLGRFIGRPVEVDQAVLESERATGHRNRAIGHLLRASGAIDGDAGEAVDRYFVQCSVAVSAVDLARVAATLANGGVDPVTGERIVSAATVRTVLSVMATCGMYDGAGEWLVSVGLPAKSGVAGGLLAVVPGRLGIGVYSPPLDAQGNSVRAAAVCRDLVHDLHLHALAGGGAPPSPIRASYTIAEVGSRVRRTAEERQVLGEHGQRALVIELQGALGFLAADAIAGRLRPSPGRAAAEVAILDLRRVERVEPAATGLLAGLLATTRAAGTEVVVASPGPHLAALEAIAAALRARPDAHGGPVATAPDLDAAIEAAEERILGGSGAGGTEVVALAEQHATAGMSTADVAELGAMLVRRTFRAGTAIVRAGDPAVDLYLVERGRCTVAIDLPGGTRRRLTTLGPGRAFGETALIGGERRGADVVADGEVTCLVLSATAFDLLAQRRPAVATRLLRNLLGSSVQTAGRLTAELAVLAG